MKDIQQGNHACNHQNLYHSFPSCIKLIFIAHNVTGPEKTSIIYTNIHVYIRAAISILYVLHKIWLNQVQTGVHLVS